ncbi:Protein-L-isoaspartate O-methyltransferase [Gulbenkiania indica]|uniref:Protein-L-isoaspartate O-methyltransferase n=1 Tax=Gulbenkiania indica TaxID=375574 RepID=A0A0K6GX45_9NEIS|nr:protein-L-isoaspartate O-methyltransferase [Gulbenkiania indica]CUA83140.1 Protein-L-isoaspartate O-methyltransferase [Gulbenkiania indica]
MDFEKARFNMVEQQIRPWDVLDGKILDLLFHVKREDFVAADKRTLAFTDMELPLENGALMLQPKVEARLVQELQLKPSDRVLEVGTGSGYVTALLASLASHVYSLDIDGSQLARAAARLKQAGLRNITLTEGNGINGLPQQAPFDAIFVGGSLPLVPETLKHQLAIGGRMVIIVGDEPVMRAQLIERLSEDTYSELVIFDTLTARLQGSEAIEPERFEF